MTTTKALVCERHGPPETLVYRDVEMGAPGAGKLLIAAEAAGLNFPDALIIEDRYQSKPPLPFSPGAEVAGTVAALGDGVEGFAVGDRVAAIVTWGAFSGLVEADAAQVTHMPEGVDMAVASILTLAYGTSHHALKQRAALQPGETLLVLGAAGGVGLAAVEIGKAMGAHVIAAASTPEKLAIARDHGADETIDYGTGDLKTEVKRLTGGRGVDVIYDPVGDTLAEPAFRSIAWGGRYLVIGFAGGEIPRLPLNLPLVKGAAIVGVFFGSFARLDPAGYAANMAELYGWLATGAVKPLISKRFPLARGGEAIRWMMDRKALGKVVLEIG